MMPPASFLVMLLIMIIIPSILYTCFFLINCPSSPCALFRRRSVNSGEKMVDDHVDDDKGSTKNDIELVIMSSMLGKDAECPVCLAVFVDGEELRQFKKCKHLFHKCCIDKWLASHSNCPVCRAFVSNHCYKIKEKENRVVSPRVVVVVDRSDLWQGLPDSAGLV